MRALLRILLLRVSPAAALLAVALPLAEPTAPDGGQAVMPPEPGAAVAGTWTEPVEEAALHP